MTGLSVAEIGFTALVATLPVAALTRYGGSVRVAGWLLAAYGLGSVIGALVSTPAKSIDDRVATLAIVALAVSTWPLVFELPAWGVAVSVGVNGICSGLFFPPVLSTLTIRTPIALQRTRHRVGEHAAVGDRVPRVRRRGVAATRLSESATAGFVLVVAETTVGAAIAAAGGRFSEPAPWEPSPAGLPADPPVG